MEPNNWLALALSYSRLMYQPSQEWVTALEGSFGLLQLLQPDQFAGLLGAIGQLQLPISPQFEDHIMLAVERSIDTMDAADLGEVVHGLIALDLQITHYGLEKLIRAVAGEGVLEGFSATAACGFLHLLARHGRIPEEQLLLRVEAVLQPQLRKLDAPSALQLLQALKNFRHCPENSAFLWGLDRRLQQLVPRMDATGLTTVLEDLVQIGAGPSPGLQEVMARCMRKGLARVSQGMGASLVWGVLESVMVMKPLPQPVLLDVLLPQVGGRGKGGKGKGQLGGRGKGKGKKGGRRMGGREQRGWSVRRGGNKGRMGGRGRGKRGAGGGGGQGKGQEGRREGGGRGKRGGEREGRGTGKRGGEGRGERDGQEGMRGGKTRGGKTGGERAGVKGQEGRRDPEGERGSWEKRGERRSSEG